MFQRRVYLADLREVVVQADGQIRLLAVLVTNRRIVLYRHPNMNVFAPPVIQMWIDCQSVILGNSKTQMIYQD